MNKFLKRTWANINLDYLHDNITAIKNKLDPSTKIMAVVKADGYGHGDHYISNALANDGVNFFAVSNLDEALSLRHAGITSDILILGFTPAQSALELSEQNISQTVFSEKYAKELNDYCVKNNCKVNVHIKLDTGMGRIGFIENDTIDATNEVKSLFHFKGLCFKGIFSHLSSADSLDDDSIAYTKQQVERFNRVVGTLNVQGIQFEYIHLQNSAGIAFVPNLKYTHARAGIVMYGVAPSNEEVDLNLKPVMELKSVISLVKEIDVGTSISYNRRFVSEGKMKVATVPIGYADGYPRLLSNKGEMLVNGKRAPIIGNVCMDQLMLDVTNIVNVEEGDIVTVVGTDGDEQITFAELANKIGTISYELMCLIGRRVPRVYIQNGKTIDVVDYIVK